MLAHSIAETPTVTVFLPTPTHKLTWKKTREDEEAMPSTSPLYGFRGASSIADLPGRLLPVVVVCCSRSVVSVSCPAGVLLLVSFPGRVRAPLKGCRCCCVCVETV